MTCLFSPSASMFLFLFSVFCSFLKSAPMCISWSVLFGFCAASYSCVCVCVCVCVCILYQFWKFFHWLYLQTYPFCVFFHFVFKNHSEALFNHVLIKKKLAEKFTNQTSWQIITWLSILFIYSFKIFLKKLSLFYFTILYWFCHTLTLICHECTWIPKQNPLPISHPISSLWVIPVHQPQASCILHRT